MGRCGDNENLTMSEVVDMSNEESPLVVSRTLSDRPLSNMDSSDEIGGGTDVSETASVQSSVIRSVRFHMEDAALDGDGKITSSVRKRSYLRHDSEFSVASKYYEDSSPNNLSMWQGGLLFIAENLGTGLLALPANIAELGGGGSSSPSYWGWVFLMINFPINLYAGIILHRAATHIEARQAYENRLYRDNSKNGTATTKPEPTTPEGTFTVKNITVSREASYQMDNVEDDGGELTSSIRVSVRTKHYQLHHDTATHDFIGLTQALFQNKWATRIVMVIFYCNIFLVQGNYVVVMSQSLAATIGESRVCTPVAGLYTILGVYVVAQSRTLARLGRMASLVSFLVLCVVLVQCLYAVRNAETTGVDQDPLAPASNGTEATSQDFEEPVLASTVSIFRKLAALGSIGFAVGSQKLFLNIRHELSNRSDAPSSLCIALFVMAAFYAIVITGSGSNPPTFLFDVLPEGSANRRIAGVLLWMHVNVSYAIQTQAICGSFDRIFGSRFAETFAASNWMKCCVGADDSACWSPARVRWMITTGMMVVLSYLVANAIPFFDDIVALTGAVTSVPLTLLLPAFFWRHYTKVHLLLPYVTKRISSRTSLVQQEGSLIPRWLYDFLLTPQKEVASFGLTYFSLLFMAAATLGVLYSIAKDWSNHTGGFFSCH